MFARNVVCAHCRQRRRVAWRTTAPKPETIRDALVEAIDRGVIDGADVTWGGKKLK